MKKLWLMLLAGCTVGTLSACSDGDDDPKPQNPITEVSVPATAEIGGFYTVTGKGFATTAQLYLRNASGVETATTDPTVASTGITVTIPSTLAAGVYTVVVKQDGSWDLGSVRLAAAQNPVSSVELPEVIKLNKTLEIAGNGFTADSKIILETADAAKTRTELTTTVSPTGVSCTIPSGVAAGTYNVILKHNNIDWTLGENIPAAVYKRLTGVKYSLTQTCDFSTAGGIDAVKALLLEMAGGDQEAADMYFNMLFSEGTTVMAQMSLNYNADGQITTAQQVTEAGAVDWYTFTFDGDKVSGENKQYEEGRPGSKGFSWNMSDGRVESSNVNYMRTVEGQVVSKPVDFTWNYDAANGNCTSIVYQTSGKPYTEFGFDNGNFTADGMFEYGDPAKKNNIFGVDVAKALLSIQGAYDADQALACLLRYDGTASVNLPTSTTIDSMMPEDPAKAMTCTQDADGYAIKAAWGGEGPDMMGIGVTIKSETAIEFIYE